MSRPDSFFRKLASNPSLIWKAGAGLLFLGFAVAILVIPSLTTGFTDTLRYSFAGLLFFYALFRLGTFYADYNNSDDE